MWIVGPNLLDLINFLLDTLIHLIVEERIKHLIEVHFWGSLDVLLKSGEEVVEQVLIGGGKVATATTSLDDTGHLGQHEHVVVADTICC